MSLLMTGGGNYQDIEIGGILLEEATDFKLQCTEVSSNNSYISGKIEFLEIDEI